MSFLTAKKYGIIYSICFIVAIAIVIVIRQKSAEKLIIPINGLLLQVDIATTPAEQARGLSGRQSLLDDQGMLFIFPHEQPLAFWMKDMLFPIDITWIDKNCRIVYIAKDAQPCSDQTTCPAILPPYHAQYVLETVASFTKTHHLNIGDRLIVSPACNYQQ